MDSLISRQAAIDLVRDVCDAVMSGCESWYDPETEDEVYKDIREVDAILKCNKEVRIALQNMPSAQPERRWIPCSERLPDEPGIYTVTDSKGDVVRFVFYNNESSCEYWRRCAKAWMPLPAPYQEEEPECANGCLYGWHSIECEHCTLKGKQRGSAKDDNERD